MKNVRVIGFMALFLTFFIVNAQAENAIKIAYLNLNYIFDEYVKTKEYDVVLEKKNSQYEQERNRRIEKIREAQGRSAVLKEGERQKLQEQIDKDTQGLNEFDRQQQTELRRERDEKIREILLEIEKVVREFAEKEGYTLILNDKVLLYGKKEMDVSEPVLKLLNERYQKK